MNVVDSSGWRVSLWMLLLAGGLAGQPSAQKDLQKELTSKLSASQHAHRDATQRSDELMNAIMALAEAGHRPSRTSVATLARELTEALSGRKFPTAAANQLANSIIGVLHSAGTATAEFRQSISRFEKTLSGIGVSATATQTIARRLTEVGKEVRGPEDTPLRP